MALLSLVRDTNLLTSSLSWKSHLCVQLGGVKLPSVFLALSDGFIESNGRGRCDLHLLSQYKLHPHPSKPLMQTDPALSNLQATSWQQTVFMHILPSPGIRVNFPQNFITTHSYHCEV